LPAPSDLAALVARSALKLETIETIVIAWPESFSDQLDTLLAEAPNARRVILSWNPSALEEFSSAMRAARDHRRHAARRRRATAGPVASARYAIVAAGRKRFGTCSMR